ncbi:hypothetical protein ACFV0W_35065, partial [Streptomyces anulatus]
MEKPTERASIPDAACDTRTTPNPNLLPNQVPNQLPTLPPLDPGGPGGPAGSGLGSGSSFGSAPGPSGLWNRNFRYFFVARTVALFGDGMIPVALTAGLLGAGRPASSGGGGPTPPRGAAGGG